MHRRARPPRLQQYDPSVYPRCHHDQAEFLEVGHSASYILELDVSERRLDVDERRLTHDGARSASMIGFCEGLDVSLFLLYVGGQGKSQIRHFELRLLSGDQKTPDRRVHPELMDWLVVSTE